MLFAQMRLKVLSDFTSSLISDLEAEGFTFREFLLALADWSESSSRWQTAAYHLEQAANPPQDQSPPNQQSDSKQSEQV